MTVLYFFTQTEISVIQEVKKIIESGILKDIETAFENNISKEFIVGNRIIVVEPKLPFSGFTLMGENSFILGKDAFESQAEMIKTLLHEIFRLEHSILKENVGITQQQAASETNEAFDFAERAFNLELKPEIEKHGFKQHSEKKI